MGQAYRGGHRDDHLIARGDVIQPLGLVFTDPDHVAAAARADDATGLDHALDARQVFRQGTCLARCARLALFGVRLTGRNPVLDSGDLRLRLGDGSFQIFQRQFQLRGVQLLGFWPELLAPIILNLTFQLLDQRLQLGDEGFLLRDHRLFVLARRALNPRLKLRGVQRRLLGGKGLHHLGRQVRELAEIEGLRHALFYPIRGIKTNETTPKLTR